jgi:sortase B
MEKNKKIYLIISIVSFVIALIALITIGMLLVSFKKGEEDYNRLAQQARERIRPIAGSIINDEEEIPEETMPDPVDIPIDFEFLKGENQDIVAWIQVDGTNIDYPVLYDTTYNMYYLHHNYNGVRTVYGSIFVLGANAADFTDFNTVVYGHNIMNRTMFAQLHEFRKKEFFDSHGTITIYTPDRKLTYQVFAAYRTDSLNIIDNNDFSTEEFRAEYIDSIYAHDAVANFKPEYQVTPSDRIITLSTCINNASFRYVVQGVLVSDEYGVYTGAQVIDEDVES